MLQAAKIPDELKHLKDDHQQKKPQSGLRNLINNSYLKNYPVSYFYSRISMINAISVKIAYSHTSHT